MTVATLRSMVVPAFVAQPMVTIQFRLLRDGEVSSDRKRLRIFRDWDSVAKLELIFEAELGEFTRPVRVDLATLLAQGEWLVTGIAPALPRRTRAVYMTFSASGTYTYNITGGDGGQQGDPAQLTALVRVERLPASREIVLIERPADGEWRLAGFGLTPGGEGVISARVVGGDVYAVGVDDYGVAFVPGLSVFEGQRIRPTSYAGWIYQITEAGVLPSIEPEWWAAEGDNASRPLGTARAIAVRYYRPLAHGPIPVEVI